MEVEECVRLLHHGACVLYLYLRGYATRYDAPGGDVQVVF